MGQARFRTLQLRQAALERETGARTALQARRETTNAAFGTRESGQAFAVDPANGMLRVLTNGRLDESPSFAPNGAQIIYATRENGRGVLASVSTDGLIQTQIASVAGDVQEPVWGPFPRP